MSGTFHSGDVANACSEHSSDGASDNDIRSSSASSEDSMGASSRGKVPIAKPNAMGGNMDQKHIQ